MTLKKIRVLVVDDSAVIRNFLTHILDSDPGISVVGTAIDPFMARERIVELNPDVITLDIEMPRMDGVTFLGKLMKHKPIPTVIISSLSKAGSQMALQAMAAGAVEVLAKPAINVKEGLEQIRLPIIQAVKAAASANLSAQQRVSSIHRVESASSLSQTTHQILAIASSTGGTEALKVLLPALPANIPGTVIVQHIPPVFSKTFAECLNKLCAFEVKEAEDGDRVTPGRVLIAPGNFHMELTRSGAYYYVNLNQNPTIHGVRPAADILMNSVAKLAGANATGVVLTGMGKDGAQGLLAMKKAGAFTIAQDEASCVVYGMPREAVEAGAVDKISPLNQIPSLIVNQVKLKSVA
jgi:two-component system chemotaxis response regulator CheB